MAATKLVRNSTGLEYRSFTPGVVSSNLTGPTGSLNGDVEGFMGLKGLREIHLIFLIHPNHSSDNKRMNSSTAEQVFVRHQVESSNLSSSAKNVSAAKLESRSGL